MSNRLSQTVYKSAGNTVTTWARPAAGPGSVRPHAATSQTITPPTGSPTTTALSYDAAGNTTGRTGTSGAVWGAPAAAQALTYNAENRLERVVQGAETVTYADHADGAKLVRRDAATTTLYVGNTELVLNRASGVVSGAAPLVRRWDGGGGYRNTAADTVTLWSDLNNTATWQVNNGTGAVEARRTLPYGEPRGPVGAFKGSHGFVDGTNDLVGNFTRVGARDYDPGTGQFLTPDPVLGLERSDAVEPVVADGGGNPLTRPDPTGLRPDDTPRRSTPGSPRPGPAVPVGSRRTRRRRVGRALRVQGLRLRPWLQVQPADTHHRTVDELVQPGAQFWVVRPGQEVQSGPERLGGRGAARPDRHRCAFHCSQTGHWPHHGRLGPVLLGRYGGVDTNTRTFKGAALAGEIGTIFIPGGGAASGVAKGGSEASRSIRRYVGRCCDPPGPV